MPATAKRITCTAPNGYVRFRLRLTSRSRSVTLADIEPARERFAAAARRLHQAAAGRELGTIAGEVGDLPDAEIPPSLLRELGRAFRAEG